MRDDQSLPIYRIPGSTYHSSGLKSRKRKLILVPAPEREAVIVARPLQRLLLLLLLLVRSGRQFLPYIIFSLPLDRLLVSWDRAGKIRLHSSARV